MTIYSKRYIIISVIEKDAVTKQIDKLTRRGAKAKQTPQSYIKGNKKFNGICQKKSYFTVLLMSVSETADKTPKGLKKAKFPKNKNKGDFNNDKKGNIEKRNA